MMECNVIVWFAVFVSVALVTEILFGYPSSEFSINNMGKLSHEVFSVDEHENLFTGRYNYGKGQWELSNGKIVHSTTRLRWMYKPKAFKL